MFRRSTMKHQPNPAQINKIINRQLSLIKPANKPIKKVRADLKAKHDKIISEIYIPKPNHPPRQPAARSQKSDPPPAPRQSATPLHPPPPQTSDTPQPPVQPPQQPDSIQPPHMIQQHLVYIPRIIQTVFMLPKHSPEFLREYWEAVPHSYYLPRGTT